LKTGKERQVQQQHASGQWCTECCVQIRARG
jgi:hypothetical protein